MGPNSVDIDRTKPFDIGRLFCLKGEGETARLPYDLDRLDWSDSLLSRPHLSVVFEGVMSSCRGSAGTARIVVPFGVRGELWTDVLPFDEFMVIGETALIDCTGSRVYWMFLEDGLFSSHRRFVSIC